MASSEQDTKHPALDAVQEGPGSASFSSERAKPRLRGRLHAGMVPVVLVAGIVLIVLAPAGMLRAAAVVYVITGLMMFVVSAVYHVGNWSKRTGMRLKRWDHTNIMLIIAGTYTPLTLALLPEPKDTILLVSVWIGALLGAAFRIFWTTAPRWLYTPSYVILGLAALVFIGDFYAADPVAATLIVVGGAAYIIGAVFYALKRPNISPKWFGFHELFHACTLIGFICHFIATALALLS